MTRQMQTPVAIPVLCQKNNARSSRAEIGIAIALEAADLK